MPSRKGRTLPCKICGEPYTDRIDPKVNPEKGGYIICAKCSMSLADAYPEKAKQIEIDPKEVVDAIKDKKLSQFRKSLGLTQEDLAGRLGLKNRQYRSIEKNQYIPSVKVLRKFEIKIMQGNGLGG